MTLQSPAPSPAGPREWASLGVLTLAVMLLAVDGTVLALAVPSLSASLEPTSTQLLWIGDIYSFALAGLLVTMGNVADRIGRKKLLLIGSAGFGIASAIAAFAPSPEVLIAARALLGVSGATIMPSTLSIIRHVFTIPAQRTRAIAVWSVGAGGGAALGPLVGGILLENFWWGSVFLINIPVMLILLISGAVLLPESRNPRPGKLDLLSALLSIASIVAVVYAVKHTFSSGVDAIGFAALVLGLLTGWVFIRRQRLSSNPMLDIELFRLPAFRGAVVANGLSIFALSGLLFFFSQYLQLVRGYGPLKAGLAELPVTIAMMTVVFVIGFAVARFGVGRSVGGGLLLGAAGLVLLAGAEELGGYLGIAVALVVTGLGIGLAMTLSTDAVVASAPRERAGAASSISETAYELGVALGIAVLGSVLSALYRTNLPAMSELDAGTRAAVTDSLASGLQVLDDDATQLIADAQNAFTDAMQVTSLIAALILAVAGIIAWRVIPVRLETNDGSHGGGAAVSDGGGNRGGAAVNDGGGNRGGDGGGNGGSAGLNDGGSDGGGNGEKDSRSDSGNADQEAPGRELSGSDASARKSSVSEASASEASASDVPASEAPTEEK
ncbi:MFS transporter [Arthrobacter sp. YD2]|uniref:MFS transporter n=1 Tax=Arthrobacter sp. YD2 TaxID=3058046 RepID=UPI0025B309EE|nr:MFS transporter [Arthrobacter sp. YD2]MDN3904806.1 MFS transporter [Arthrobacter sp. YD2]